MFLKKGVIIRTLLIEKLLKYIMELSFLEVFMIRFYKRPELLSVKVIIY